MSSPYLLHERTENDFISLTWCTSHAAESLICRRDGIQVMHYTDVQPHKLPVPCRLINHHPSSAELHLNDLLSIRRLQQLTGYCSMYDIVLGKASIVQYDIGLRCNRSSCRSVPLGAFSILTLAHLCHLNKKSTHLRVPSTSSQPHP